MSMKPFAFFLIVCIIFSACAKDDPVMQEPENEDVIDPIDSMESTIYFPPINNDNWEMTDPDELSWHTENLQTLYDLLESNGTRGFIILVNGKIVIEKYFGKDLLNIADFKSNTNWYWASAGKTLTAFTVGKAQEDGLLSLSDKTSDFLGDGWTSLQEEQEDKITVWHQMTMTTGLDDKVSNNHSFEPEDLQYKADPGTRWAYHNAPYTLLDNVIESATNATFEDYFNDVLRDKIGMDGFWSWIGDDHVFFSTARSMARYGLLISNNGDWADTQIINDKSFVQQMINPSQSINESYGYLWWLNGYNSYMLPELQIKIPGSITPSAPDDMVSGIGKNGQYLSIIPSLNMVMVRMGENPDQVAVPLLFQRDIWDKMKDILP